MARNNIIPIFIPFAGCKYQCSYCNQWKITGENSLPSREDIRNNIEKQLNYFSNPHPIEVAFYGGTFTMLPFETQLEYFQVVNEFRERGDVNEIRFSTRPDQIQEEELKILKSLGLQTIELGIQSIDHDVLSLSNRHVMMNQVKKSIDIIHGLGIVLGLQQMIGLPEDSLHKTMRTARWIIEKKPSFVRIYPTLVIRGTDLEDWYSSGKYEPLSFTEAVMWTSQLLDLYEKYGISVIRVGLPPIEDSKDIIAGPYHPQFREYAESDRLVKRILSVTEKTEEGDVLISASKTNINRIVGPKGYGRDQLEHHIGGVVSFNPIKKDDRIEISYQNSIIEMTL